jgi:C4-dicarboxylate-specific signal transduction histidine kinase
MPRGGTIDVSVHTESEADDSPVVIRFRDSGPGIHQENPNDIFLPFSTTKRGKDQQNLGLGLSVTYGIIRKYNGTIAVENLATEGCQFTIRIPRS